MSLGGGGGGTKMEGKPLMLNLFLVVYCLLQVLVFFFQLQLFVEL